MDIYSFINA